MQYKINKPIRIIELFGGYMSQSLALKYLGVDYESYKLSEWEKNAIAAAHAIHFPDDITDYSKNLSKDELVKFLVDFGLSNDGKSPMEEKSIAKKGESWLREVYNDIKATRNVGSILNIHAEDLEIVDQDKFEYIMTYSFPCQDLSLAGKQRGMDKGSETRSALLWEVQRLLEECKEQNCLPNVLLLENVNQIHGKKNIENFNTWLSILEDLGYSNFWQDLNAKDYTVPQNRVRTFVISILGDYEYEFPKPIELKKRLKDVLEDEVDESYYINTEKADALIGTLIDKGVLPEKSDAYSLKNMGSSDESREPDAKQTDVAHTILSRDWRGLSNYGSNGIIEKEQMGIDLTTNNPQNREVSNCLKAGARGITNFAQDETGVVESVV